MLTRFISPCTLHPAFNAARVHRNSQPALVTTYDRPFGGLGCATHTIFPNFGKVEYFWQAGLTAAWLFCPTGNLTRCQTYLALLRTP
jgi:hypothetical protein